MEVAKKAARIKESLTLAITAKAKKMNEDGIKVISFGAGEPDFNTPDYVIKAAKDAMDAGKTKYTPSAGILPLRKAICLKLKRDNNLSYEPKNIVVSNGAKHSLYNALLGVINKGDEVLIPAPFWLTYPELVLLCDGIPKYIKTKERSGFKLLPDQLRKAITKKTKAIILNSPCNPTGSVYSKEELFELAKVVEETGIIVISDEIYEKLIYNGEHYSIAQYSQKVFDQTIVVNGVSKAYSMTGWRIGYLAAPANVAAAIDSVQSHTTSNPNSIAQYAALEALNNNDQFISNMAAAFDKRRKYIIKRVKKIPNLTCINPDGAFYVMLKVSKLFGKSINGILLDSAQRVAEVMLDTIHVAAVPCESFGAPDYIRLSYAISDKDIEEGMDRIEKFVGMLK